MYYDDDADLGLLKGKTVAVIGFGSQGHAHAQNLQGERDRVVVAEAEGSPGWKRAVDAGIEVLPTAEAAKRGQVVIMLVPDQDQKVIYEKFVRDNLEDGDMLMFAHGFNIHFNQIVPPAERGRHHGGAQEPGASGPPHVPAGQRRARPGGRLPGRHRQGQRRRRWPTPRASAPPAPGSSRPPSRRRPRPTCSASRWSSAVA